MDKPRRYPKFAELYGKFPNSEMVSSFIERGQCVTVIDTGGAVFL